MTWDGRDVYRDEDDHSYDEARDVLFYGRHEYDPRIKTHVEGAVNPDGKKPCPRCSYLHVPEDGCECKKCAGRTDEDGYCSFCGATRPIGRAA